MNIKRYENVLHSDDSEMSLIGCVLLEPQIIDSLEDFRSDHFYQPLHKNIWDIIIELNKEGLSLARSDLINKILLSCSNNEQKSIKIQDHLKNCFNASVTIINPVSVARYIKRLATKRNIVIACKDCINDVLESSETANPNALLEAAEEKLFNIAIHGYAETNIASLSLLAENALKEAEVNYKNKERITGVTSGLHSLDKIINGFHKSDLVILAGRPAMGKTALAMNMAYNAAKEQASNKGSVLFFSLEMSASQLTNRIMSMATGVNAFNIRCGKFSQKDYDEMVLWAREYIKNLNLYIDDTPSMTISLIRTRARKFVRNKNLSIIFIDYLQLIQTHNLNKNFNRTNEISIITRELKQLAKELNVPIIVLSQLSRAVESREDKKPVLSDLRESGSIEQDADIVMFIYREEYYTRKNRPKEGTAKHDEWVNKVDKAYNAADIIISKHRNGPIADIPVYFDSKTTLFKDIDFIAVK